MIQRLLDFYKRASATTGELSEVWSSILRDSGGLLGDALKRGDKDALQDVFDDPRKAIDAMQGLDTPIMEFWGYQITSGHLPALGQRIGVVPIFHPLNPSPDENWNPKDGLELKRKIEEVIGPIRVPDGFLVKDNSRGVPYTCFEKLAQWFTIQSLLGSPPTPGYKVLEIGAGTGGLALAAFNNGVRDYTIIDIPAIAVQAAYYLAKALGKDLVWLDGEPPSSNAVFRWFSCFDYESARATYDLMVNINSFPEMTLANQDGYIRFIHECLSKDGLFYSCNHESNMKLAGTVQSSVRSAVNRHGGFKAIYRAPFMLRQGYMEEFYRTA